MTDPIADSYRQRRQFVFDAVDKAHRSRRRWRVFVALAVLGSLAAVVAMVRPWHA